MSRMTVVLRAITARTKPGTLRHAWSMARGSYSYSRHAGLTVREALEGAWDQFRDEWRGPR